MRQRRLYQRVGFNLLLGAVFAALASACAIGFVRMLINTPAAKLTIVDVVGIPLLGAGLTGFFVWLTYRFSSEALGALKDFSVEPLTITDHVYSGRSMVGGDAPPVYYLTVGDKEFEVDGSHFRAVVTGDIVRVTYWPNSELVENVEVLHRFTPLQEEEALELARECAIAQGLSLADAVLKSEFVGEPGSSSESPAWNDRWTIYIVSGSAGGDAVDPAIHVIDITCWTRVVKMRPSAHAKPASPEMDVEAGRPPEPRDSSHNITPL
jgi:hypothetical protein